MKKRLNLVPDVRAVPAIPVKICCYPGCFKELGERNISGVCVPHLHHQPFCHCGNCISTGNQQRVRIRTREEMVKLGLLPK